MRASIYMSSPDWVLHACVEGAEQSSGFCSRCERQQQPFSGDVSTRGSRAADERARKHYWGGFSRSLDFWSCFVEVDRCIKTVCEDLCFCSRAPTPPPPATQTMRLFTGGRDDKEHQQQQHRGHPGGEPCSEDTGNGDSSGGAGNSSIFRDAGGRGGGGGGGRRGLFAPVPQRPDRSPSPALQGGSLENSPAITGRASPMRRQGRSPSPTAALIRRASFSAATRPWNFLDLRGGHGTCRYYLCARRLGGLRLSRAFVLMRQGPRGVVLCCF